MEQDPLFAHCHSLPSVDSSTCVMSPIAAGMVEWYNFLSVAARPLRSANVVLGSPPLPEMRLPEPPLPELPFPEPPLPEPPPDEPAFALAFPGALPETTISPPAHKKKYFEQAN